MTETKATVIIMVILGLAVTAGFTFGLSYHTKVTTEALVKCVEATKEPLQCRSMLGLR